MLKSHSRKNILSGIFGHKNLNASSTSMMNEKMFNTSPWMILKVVKKEKGRRFMTSQISLFFLQNLSLIQALSVPKKYIMDSCDHKCVIFKEISLAFWTKLHEKFPFLEENQKIFFKMLSNGYISLRHFNEIIKNIVIARDKNKNI